MSTDEGHSHCLTRSPEDGAYYHARWIGKPISDASRSAKSVLVRGTTSRGIFLELDTGWIAFLSSETYRGPLTLNLDENFNEIDILTPGVRGEISNDVIRLFSPDITIDTRKARIWSSFENIKQKNPYEHMAMRTIEARNFAYRLAEVLQTPNEYLEFIRKHLSKSSDSPANPLEKNLAKLMTSIQTCDTALLETPLQFIVGRGRGLTPSGDDFLAGLLLGLHLLKKSASQIDLTIRQTIIDTIRCHSTLISANLAECASVGEVDERIAKAVEYLLIGSGTEEDTMRGILDWGSSSGVETIAGFLTAFNLMDTNLHAI